MEEVYITPYKIRIRLNPELAEIKVVDNKEFYVLKEWGTSETLAYHKEIEYAVDMNKPGINALEEISKAILRFKDTKGIEYISVY